MAGSRIWDTSAMSDEDQWAHWRDVVWEAFVPVSLSRPADGPFPSRVAVSSLGGVGVAHIGSRAQSVARTAHDIARHTSGRYFLNLPLRGRGTMTQHGRTADLRPGDFALVDGEAPFELAFDDDFDQLSLTIPHELLAPLIAEPERVTGVRVRGDSGVGAMASAGIRIAGREAPRLTHGEAEAAARHVVELVALAVRGLAVTPRRALGRGLLVQAARDEIAQSFSDPELTPSLVASRIAVSVRYLHRLFADEGTTFGRELLRTRIAAVRRQLEDPAWNALTITELAFRNGFGDPTHLGKVFKTEVGHTPRDYRRHMQASR